MSTISVEDVERNPLAFLRLLEAGKGVVIERDGRPLAEVSPIAVPPAGLRPYGLCAGEFVVPDDFDDPLPEDVLRDFEGT